ncbi:hypothetical protein [Myxosarcina sp. GI1(2024)]
MTKQKRWCRLETVATAIGTITISTSSALAQNTLAHLNLVLGFERATAVVTGYTNGSYSLASIANRDRHDKPCMGYGDPKPDHTMVLQNDFEQLSLHVNSGGKNTTLVVKGSGKENIRCAFGKKAIRDALLQDTNWQRGEYHIWVGSMQPNQRTTYRLSVKQ